MSIENILTKLAEKEAAAGNYDYAYRLVEASEKCDFCGTKKGEMMKRKGKTVCSSCAKVTKCALKGCKAKMMYGEMVKKGGKAYCCKDCAKEDTKMKKTALDEMLEKYASKNSYKDAIKDLPGFTGMFGDGFCFMNKDQAKKAIAIAESAANFLKWSIERHDDGFMVIPRGMDKKSEVLVSMIKKYAQNYDPYAHEFEDYKMERGFLGEDEPELDEEDKAPICEECYENRADALCTDCKKPVCLNCSDENGKCRSCSLRDPDPDDYPDDF